MSAGFGLTARRRPRVRLLERRGPVGVFLLKVVERWWIVILGTLVSGVLAIAVGELKPARYQSVTTVRLTDDPNIYQTNLSVLKVLSPGGLEAQLQLLQSMAVKTHVSKQTGIPLAELDEMISVTSPGIGTFDLSITATERGSPAGVAHGLLGRQKDRVHRVRDALLEAYTQERREAQRVAAVARRQKIARTLAGNPSRAVRSRLERELQFVRILERQILPGVSVIASSNNGPEPRRTGLLGLGVGSLVGLGMALLLALLDDRLRTSRELEQLLSAPVLGPLQTQSRRRSRGTAQPMLRPEEAVELLKGARRVWEALGEGSRDVAVVVPTGTDAATTQGPLRLATALALYGLRVVALDTSPSPGNSAGLTDIVTDTTDFADVAVRQALPHLGESATAGELYLARASLPPNVSNKARIKQLIELLQTRVDLVLVLARPSSRTVDLESFFAYSQAAVLLAKLRDSRRDDLSSIVDELGRHDVPVVGAVLLE